MDEVDQQILELLQENARVSNAEIARQVGMVPSGVLDRIRRLEERGLIEGYRAKINPKKLGLGLLAFIFVVTDELPGETPSAEALAEIPEVLEVHHIAGEDCYVAKVRVADTDALADLIKHKIGGIAAVRNTRTTIVLETLKETARLPIPDAD
jgi:Lrp/AsnC family leucine-responsive transcriptional regulator